MAHALGMTHKTGFCFVVVENVEPYCVAAYTIDMESDELQFAWKMLTQAMSDLSFHLTRNQWADFGDYQPLKFPNSSKFQALDSLKELGLDVS